MTAERKWYIKTAIKALVVLAVAVAFFVGLHALAGPAVVDNGPPSAAAGCRVKWQLVKNDNVNYGVSESAWVTQCVRETP